MIDERDEIRSTLQERVNLFRSEGYRGFIPGTGSSKTDYTIGVTAINQEGFQVTAEGETLDEAYENLIETIDTMLDR